MDIKWGKSGQTRTYGAELEYTRSYLKSHLSLSTPKSLALKTDDGELLQEKPVPFISDKHTP